MATACRYYYQQLNKSLQSVYDRLLKGLTDLDTAIRVPALDMVTLNELLFQLRLDHPEIFYVVTFRVRGYQGADHVDLLPEYLFDRDRIRTHKKAIEARVERILRPLKGMGQEAQEEAVHSLICSSVTYDKLKKPYSHEVIGPLTNGVGVCEGIAKSVKLLCDGLGIECMVAICDADPEHGQKYRHAWNILKLNGTWYHLDATFDLSLSRCGEERFDYYNLGDSHFYKDHRRPMYPAPACPDSSAFRYKEKKLSWTKTEEVDKRIRQALRKKKPGLVFHWRGGSLNGELLNELAGLIFEAVREKEKGALMSVNRPQGVVCVRFTDAAEPEQVDDEQPDEGEETA